jgi:hypothetical protein
VPGRRSHATRHPPASWSRHARRELATIRRIPRMESRMASAQEGHPIATREPVCNAPQISIVLALPQAAIPAPTLAYAADQALETS